MLCLCLAKRCLVLAVLIAVAFLSICRRHIDPTKTGIKLVWKDDSGDSHVIPKRIWQINPWENQSMNPEWVTSWMTKNLGHTYTLMSLQNGESFVRAHFHDPSIVNTFTSLQNPILKSDLLRYLLVLAKGGIYSDLDTEVVRSIEDWVPEGIKDRVRVVLGIEYDQQNNPRRLRGMYKPVQICQWTIASTKEHPLMRKMVDAVVRSLKTLAKEKETTLADLEPTEEDVLEHTGPAKWSEVVVAYLSEITGTEITYRDLSNLRLPRLYGDVLVMPIDSFGTGQQHSSSSWVNNDVTLVRHHFKSMWRSDIRQKEMDAVRPAARWSFPEVADRLRLLDAQDVQETQSMKVK